MNPTELLTTNRTVANNSEAIDKRSVETVRRNQLQINQLVQKTIDAEGQGQYDTSDLGFRRMFDEWDRRSAEITKARQQQRQLLIQRTVDLEGWGQ